MKLENYLYRWGPQGHGDMYAIRIQGQKVSVTMTAVHKGRKEMGA